MTTAVWVFCSRFLRALCTKAEKRQPDSPNYRFRLAERRMSSFIG
jgi:hypothetical protein